MAKQYTIEELEQIKKLNIDINNATEEQLKHIDDLLEKQKSLKQTLAEQIKDLELMSDLYGDNSMKKQAEVLKVKEQIKANEENYKQLLKQKKALEDQGENADHISQALEECRIHARELTGNLEKANVELEKTTQKAKSVNEKIQEMGKKVLDVINNFVSLKNNVVGLMSSIDDMTGGFNFPQSVLFSFDKLVATLKAAAQEVVKSLQTVTTSTGVVLSAHNQILNQGLGRYAIANKELAESFSNLYSNMNQFSSLNAKEQANLTASAAKMKNLGVDTKIYAQNLQLLNNSFGMTATTSNRTLEELAQKAREAGITPQKMFADLNTSMGNLAAYGGKKALEVFVEMQKQSKVLGIEIGKLNGIVGNTWDTFEGAAQKAGGLNAILGGDFLNATQMLNATESERVMILKKSIEASGQNWQSMDKFQKLSIMNTLGIKDQAEAEAMFGKSVSSTEDQMKKKVNTETTLAQAQLAGADAMRKLELAQRGQAAAAKDVVAELQKLFALFQKLIAGKEKLIAKTTIYGTVIATLVGILMGISAFVASVITAFIALKAALAGGGRSAANVIRQIGQAAARSVVGILALGAAMWMIGKGIAAAAEGMAVLVKAFASLQSTEQILGALGAMTILLVGFVGILYAMIGAVAGLAAAGTAGAVGLLALGAAFLLIGLGIGLAAAGFYLVSKAIQEMAANNQGIGEFSMTLLKLAMGMGAMLLVMMPFGLASLFIGPGLIALGLAFTLLGIGVALALNPINDLVSKSDAETKLKSLASGISAVVDAMAGMGKMGVTGGIGSFLVGGLGDVSEMVDDLMESVNKMPSDIEVRARAFAELGASIANVATINAENLRPANDFVNNVKTLYETQTKSANAQNNMFMAMISGISKLGEKDKKEGEIEIVLRVDDQSFKGYIGASAIGTKAPTRS